MYAKGTIVKQKANVRSSPSYDTSKCSSWQHITPPSGNCDALKHGDQVPHRRRTHEYIVHSSEKSGVLGCSSGDVMHLGSNTNSRSMLEGGRIYSQIFKSVNDFLIMLRIISAPTCITRKWFDKYQLMAVLSRRTCKDATLRCGAFSSKHTQFQGQQLLGEERSDRRTADLEAIRYDSHCMTLRASFLRVIDAGMMSRGGCPWRKELSRSRSRF